WLRSADGGLLKADALDHDVEHDLIGPQDLAWDVAGAAVELGFSATALAAQTALISGRTIDPDLLVFLTPCYMAFRLGAARMAQRMQDETEGRLNAQAAERYARGLTDWLDEDHSITG
ncbi:MAG TPA: hypothetical protein VF633_03655, partial [Brevundimonas sp.]